MSQQASHSNRRAGFTLVELAVSLVIIGVLATFGIPRFLESVERSKAAEGFGYLATIRAAQERYKVRQGVYASTLEQLDIPQPAPRYFTVGSITATDNTWTLTLTRKNGASDYGIYTVTFTQDGLDPSSTIVHQPEINPTSS
jgi:prepilin-type N-terminal cleavage/methylation domain-containing protein